MAQWGDQLVCFVTHPALAHMPELKREFVPLYYQLSSDLEAKIDAGEYPPGSRLPAETLLAEQYGVSLITARGAMKLLLDRGRVERWPGKGTFVLQQEPVRAVWGMGSLADIDMTGTRSDMTTVWRRSIGPPDWVKRDLGLAGEAKVHTMRNIRSVDGEPFMVSDIYHHPRLTRIVKGRNFLKVLAQRKLVIMAVSELADIALGEIQTRMSATLAEGSIAQALGLEAGKPLLVIERTFCAEDGRPLQAGRTHYRVDHYRYNLNLSRIEKGESRKKA